MTGTAQLRSELVKTRSAHPLVWLPIAAGLAAPMVAVFVGLTDSLQPDDTILGAASTGVPIGLGLLGVWAALVVTTEFGSGTIRPVVAASPHRVSVLSAKAVLVTVVATIVGLAAMAAAYPIGLATLDHATHPVGQPLPAVLGIAALHAVFALAALALGVLIRSSAGAVVAVVAVLIVPGVLAPITGPAGGWIGGAGPSAVAAKLAQSSDAVALGFLGGWASLAATLGYTIVLMGLGAWSFERRDL